MTPQHRAGRPWRFGLDRNSALHGGEKPDSASASETATTSRLTITGCASKSPLPDEPLAVRETAGNRNDQYPYPHFAAIKGTVDKKVGAETKIIDWTH